MTPDDPHFFIALDHRVVLRDLCSGLVPEDAAAAAPFYVEIKAIGVEAAIAAQARLGQRIGILIDSEFGAQSARMAHEHGLCLAMPIEQSGASTFTLDHGEEFLAELQSFPVDFAKCLLLLNPDDEAGYQQQVGDASAALRAVEGAGIATMLEVMLPPTQEQLTELGGDRHRYDSEVRPALTLRVIEDFYGQGIRPRLWKLEGFESKSDYSAVARAIAGVDARAESLVLSRGASPEQVLSWLLLSATVKGFNGFALGRGIWEETIRAWLTHQVSREDAVGRICDQLVYYAESFNQARTEQSVGLS